MRQFFNSNEKFKLPLKKTSEFQASTLEVSEKFPQTLTSRKNKSSCDSEFDSSPQPKSFKIRAVAKQALSREVSQSLEIADLFNTTCKLIEATN